MKIKVKIEQTGECEVVDSTITVLYGEKELGRTDGFFDFGRD